MGDQRTADLVAYGTSRHLITGHERADRAIFGAKETSHPANQWMANELGRRRLALQLAEAREWALFYVRGAMAPEFQDWGACAREARRLQLQGSRNAMAALVRGWEDHRGPEQRRALENYRQRYALLDPLLDPQVRATLSAGRLPRARVLP